MTQRNREQIEYWNERAGPRWVARQAHLDRMLAPIGGALLERAAVQPGEQVLDVGCGCGESTLALADRGAEVLSVDVSAPMLARARERAAGRKNIALREADAAFEAFEPVHGLVFSRFGLMFFDEPLPAFSNLRRALVPNGRLAFCCWQGIRENPWVGVPAAAVRPYLPEPEEAPDPQAPGPGPFVFADAEYVRGILDGAGFGAINIESFRTRVHLGDTVSEAAAFMEEVGPISRALADLDEATRRAAVDAVQDAFVRHAGAKGVRLYAASYLVTARNA